MKFIDKRDERLSPLFNVGIFLLILPTFGLISGTAISVGIFGANYQEISIVDDADRYWFTIYVELIVSFTMVVLSYIRFPIYEFYYGKILSFRESNKLLFFVLAFVLIPILVTGLVIFIMHAKELLTY